MGSGWFVVSSCIVSLLLTHLKFMKYELWLLYVLFVFYVPIMGLGSVNEECVNNSGVGFFPLGSESSRISSLWYAESVRDLPIFSQYKRCD